MEGGGNCISGLAQRSSSLTTCWACAVGLDVPIIQGQPAPVFKCGWCGAYNETVSNQKVGDTLHHRGTWLMTHIRRLGMVVALVMINAVFILGSLVVLPKLANGVTLWTAMALAFSLALQILFNFLGAAREPHGVAGPWSKASTAPVVQGAFDNCFFCAPCKNVKPPQAHHCRSCGKCIVEMDHHCMYLNNCVGAANMRHFLLFLFWLGLGTTYAAAACSVLLWRRRAVILQFWHTVYPSLLTGGVIHLLFFSMRVTARAPAWLSITVYVWVLCVSTLIGITLLLASQLSRLRRGQTYIDMLKHGRACGDQSSYGGALRTVFGPGNPVMWLLPTSNESTMICETGKKRT